MKVYDCFTFFNELEILELRLREHDASVDFFVITESPLTFTGQPKPLHFLKNAERFKRFRHKIIHLVIDDVPTSNDPFDREHFQRNAIVRGLANAEPDDLVVVSDVDEIIRADAFERAKTLGGYVVFDLAMYQFYLNLRALRKGWTAAYCIQKKYLARVPDLSISRWNRSLMMEEFLPEGIFHILSDAGWHFTHLGGVERLQQKFMAYSHKDDAWPKAMMLPGALQKHIVAGGVVANFRDLAEFIVIDDTFPRDVVERQEHYRRIGFIKDVVGALTELQVQHQELQHAYAMTHYDDPQPHAAIGGIRPRDFAMMAGLEPPFLDRLAAIRPERGTLLSIGKGATQSSMSPWSVGATIEADAGGAVTGYKNGWFKFHTMVEDGPWWMVDLDCVCEIIEVQIFNRLTPDEARSRANRLKIEIGSSLDALVEVYRKEDDTSFGGADGRPLICRFDRTITGRYVRLSLIGVEALHLDQVEVFGLPVPDGASETPAFSQDWFSANVPMWRNVFAGLGWDASQPKTVIELGCFEGRASLWILENLLANPASRLHCVDVFPNQDDPASYGALHRRNIATHPRANMVYRHAQYSYDFLVDFVHSNGKADFIYIDASHRAAEVLEDLVLAFQSLKVGGVIICDDYLGGAPNAASEGVLSTPKMGIDVFTTLFRDRLTILGGHPLYQLAFIKTADRERDDQTSRGIT